MESPSLETFGDRVRARRKTLGMTMSDVAKAMGKKSNWMVWAWENGERLDPSSSSVIALARVLHCSTSYLLEGTHAPKSVPKKEDI